MKSLPNLDRGILQRLIFNDTNIDIDRKIVYLLVCNWAIKLSNSQSFVPGFP